MDFKQYDEEEAAMDAAREAFAGAESGAFATELRSMADVSALSLVEQYAEENNLIDSEQALSDRFDEDVAPRVLERWGADDGPAMSEAFNNWSDALTRDGELHPIQYHEYCNVGKYR